MKIDISDLKLEQGASLKFHGEQQLNLLPFMGEEIRFPKPLQIEGMVTNTEVGFLVWGTISGELERQCGRCTESFACPLESQFEMIYRQQEAAAETHDHPHENADDDEEEVYFFKGNVLDLKELIMESVIVAIPMRALCRDECHGLCPICGQNLNEGSCSCSEEKVDDRLSALKQLLNKD